MKKIVVFGEVLLRLSPPDYTRFGQATAFNIYYAGAEYNTAISLALLGLPVSFVTRLPDNDLSIAAVQQLKRYGVEGNNICYGGKRLGTYYLEQGAVMRGSKVIYDREHSSIAEIEPGLLDWKNILKDAGWFHCTGITPAVSQAAADETLTAVKMASELGLTVSIDLNYRSKLWQYGKHPKEVMPEIMKYCNVVLGDMNTVKTYFEIESAEQDKKDSYKDCMQQLKKMFPNLQHIIFSFRDTHSVTNNSIGAFNLNSDKLIESTVFNMQGMVDRLGGGDALMVGIIYGLNKFKDNPQKSIDFAVAAAALKSSIPGDTNFVTEDEILSLMQGNTSGKINR
ncbi:sugar kinase [Sediminibacterium sp.]|jgi:2-dehydro-3-deoxygluconokinase|uniref:sugar kinase n=1 Tax=Sediminibacterium sp. TaxID=1917865 RepID=UPI0025EFADD0|nr:sugar kinase [Sediminibacterium sp.]MBW0178491.1 sugar kinase [Sediminibacterium sp.]